MNAEGRSSPAQGATRSSRLLGVAAELRVLSARGRGDQRDASRGCVVVAVDRLVGLVEDVRRYADAIERSRTRVFVAGGAVRHVSVPAGALTA